MAELHPPKAEEPAKEEKEDVIDIEAKPEITFEDFGKLQFQVGKIIKCEEVKNQRNCSAHRYRSAARCARSYPESKHTTVQKKW